MRLLSVGSLPPELGGAERGGVATFHATLLGALRGRPEEVELVGVVPPRPLDGNPPFPVFPRPEGLDARRFYESLLDRLEPDVVLMNHVAHTVGVAHARIAGAPPAVGVAHSWHSVTFRSGEARRRSRAVAEEALGGLAALVCPSTHCRREGERLRMPYPRRVETIHYPLAPLYLEEVDVGGAERGGVLFVGSLVERKNPVALVEAAALLPGAEVVLVGEGEEEPRLREAIRRGGMEERVRLVRLPASEHARRLRDLYLRSRALCLPSHSESFGIVFAEALACGTPVVGFGPTVREIAAATGVGVGEPLDVPSPEAIAAALERVLAASWDRAALRRAATNAFDLDRAADRYLRLMRECA